LEHINRYVIANDKPLYLTREEMANPAKVITAFFDSGFDLEFCRDVLRMCFNTLLSQSDEDLGTLYHRAELITFFDELERLIEAAHLLYNKHKG
jgi:hypothetical protein